VAPGRVSARQLWVVLESVHAVTYFAPICRLARREAGLPGFWAGYFAARAAPLGAVEAGPVVAAFFNFHPAMVHRAIPSSWDVVDPGQLVVDRAVAAARALAELCPSDVVTEMAAARPALRSVAARGGGEGRVMAGANRALGLGTTLSEGLRQRGLGRVETELAEVWQLCTTLREHRGDGHVAALLTHGLSGLEAHLLVSATLGQAPDVLRDSRGWTAQQWEEGGQELARRGLLAPDGRTTEAGHALRQSVEAMTDDLAETAFVDLSDEAVDALYQALLAGARQVQSSGVLPFPNPMGLPALPRAN
jgi:hypothetical protein